MIRICTTILGCAAGLLLAGCATSRQESFFPEPRDMGAQYPPAGRDAPAIADDSASVTEEPGGTLDLGQALTLAMTRNPGLAAHANAVRAAEARTRQAGALPNPELELELGEYDRNGDGFDSAEMAAVLAQAFELGGKRRARIRLAEAEGQLAGWDYEAKRLDVLAETAKRFTEMIAARERLALARAVVERAQQARDAVSERVKAGKEPPLQAAKSNAELEMAHLEATSAGKALAVARQRLASMWGAETASFGEAQGSLDQVLEEVMPLETLRSRLPHHPALARWEAERQRRHAAISGEKAGRIPDLSVSAGYLRFEEDGTDALTFGLGMPLPLFDRNTGNLAAAQHELAQAENEHVATQLALAANLAEAHADLTTARDRVAALRTKVLPAMEQAYEAAYAGYQQGKFGFLDMLDAQRGLFEARGALVDALQAYQIALIDIQRLIGTKAVRFTTHNEETDK